MKPPKVKMLTVAKLTALEKSKLPDGEIMAVFMLGDEKTVEFHDRDDPYVWNERSSRWDRKSVFRTVRSLRRK